MQVNNDQTLHDADVTNDDKALPFAEHSRTLGTTLQKMCSAAPYWKIPQSVKRTGPALAKDISLAAAGSIADKPAITILQPPVGDTDSNSVPVSESMLKEVQEQLTSLEAVLSKLHTRLELMRAPVRLVAESTTIGSMEDPQPSCSPPMLGERVAVIQRSLDALFKQVVDGQASLGAKLNFIQDTLEYKVQPVLRPASDASPSPGPPRSRDVNLLVERKGLHAPPERHKLSAIPAGPTHLRTPRDREVSHIDPDYSWHVSAAGSPASPQDEWSKPSWGRPGGTVTEDVYCRNLSGELTTTQSEAAFHWVASSIAAHAQASHRSAAKIKRNMSFIRIDGETATEKVLQTFTLIMVFVYIIFLGVMVDRKVNYLHDGVTDMPKWFDWADLGFVIAMALELALYLCVKGWSIFRGSGRKWFFYDAFLVCFALLDQLINVFSPSFLMMSRVFRAIRFARVIKSMRDMRSLRLMVASILCCLSSIVWATVLLFFVIYLFAVALLLFLTSSGHMEPWRSDASVLHEYYGALGTCMTTLFGAISGGIDWGDLMRPVEKVNTIFARVFFVGYISITLFGVMNILTAVFVQNTGQVSKLAKVDGELIIMEERHKEAVAVAALKKLLLHADTSGDGIVTLEELEQQLTRYETLLYLRCLEIDEADVRRLFGLLADGTQQVRVEEFLGGMMRLRGSAKALDTAILMLDSNRRGQDIHVRLRNIEERLDSIPAIHQAGVSRKRGGSSETVDPQLPQDADGRVVP